MIYLFIFFFFLLYAILEALKFDKIKSIRYKLNYKERFYNEPVVYIKFVVLCIDYILIVINRLFGGLVERSSGVWSFVVISLFMGLLFFLPSYLDIRKVRKGHNELIMEYISMRCK